MNSKIERRRTTDAIKGTDWMRYFATREDQAARKAIAVSACGWFIVCVVSAACFVIAIFGNW